MEDDCVCDYDSTWDTESDGDDPAGESQTRRSCQDKNKSGWTLSSWHNPSRNMRAAKDMQNYRRGYPNLTDEECSEDKMNNLQFYLNKFPSAPDEVFIESFLRDWKNDYKRLERVHSYIQWLFPLREPGVNYMASELTKKEIEAFRNNEDAKRRLVESYELMLGFYGIRLVNKETGEVKRAENWKERFGNLERNMHNNLRITRILKSLGELGFEHYQAPLVQFFLEETLVKKTLGSVKRSVLDYFLFAVRAKQERKDLLRFAYLNFEPKDKFVWCPRKIQKQFRNMEKKSETAGNGDVKEEANLRGKSKEGEAVVQVKEDGLDNVSKTPKGPDKTPSKDKNKLPEASPEPKPDTEAVENGDAENDSNNKMLNGIDSVEDDGEMDQSHSSETLMGEGKPSADTEEDLTNNSKGIIPETDSSRQTDGDTDTEKPPKKKREDKVLPSNGSAGDFASGQVEEKAGTKKATGQTSPSAQTVPKTSKLTRSDSLGRKIPRTKCSKVLGKKEEEETSQANVSATNGSQTSTEKGVEEQTNDMESVPSSSD